MWVWFGLGVGVWFVVLCCLVLCCCLVFLFGSVWLGCVLLLFRCYSVASWLLSFLVLSCVVLSCFLVAVWCSFVLFCFVALDVGVCCVDV